MILQAKIITILYDHSVYHHCQWHLIFIFFCHTICHFMNHSWSAVDHWKFVNILINRNAVHLTIPLLLGYDLSIWLPLPSLVLFIVLLLVLSFAIASVFTILYYCYVCRNYFCCYHYHDDTSLPWTKTSCYNSATILLHRSDLSPYFCPGLFAASLRASRGKKGFAVSTGSGLEEDDHLMAFELFRRAVPLWSNHRPPVWKWFIPSIYSDLEAGLSLF